MKTRIFVYVLLAVALGAALGWTGLHALRWRSPESEPPALPAYGIELSHDREEGRMTSVRVAPGSLLTLVLRPAENVVGPVAARGFLWRAGAWQPWAVHLDRADSGTFALRARVRDLPALGPGKWKTAFLVGRPASLPAVPDAARRGDPHPDWQVLEGEIDLSE